MLEELKESLWVVKEARTSQRKRKWKRTSRRMIRGAKQKTMGSRGGGGRMSQKSLGKPYALLTEHKQAGRKFG